KLFDAVKQINSIAAEKASITKEDQELLHQSMHEFAFDILGLVPMTSQSKTTNDDTSRMENLVELLIELRKKARLNRDFALSDQIRDELAHLNIELKDSREGTSYTL
ncbi:MAG: cysteine--tRNA ligase, partial [Mesonia sp.]